MRTNPALALLLVIAAPFASALELSLNAESGFLAVLSHSIKYGEDERSFRYDREGGQDTLFPFLRFSVEAAFNERHTVVFLYQPLQLETRVQLDKTRVIDGVTFPAGDTLRLFYGFPFYRVSYLYTLTDRPRWRLEIGGGLQIRNATIEFEDTDGTAFVGQRDVGPVPLLKARGVYRVTDELWIGVEVDGIYAPVSYLNGSSRDVVGAILDASLRAGYELQGNLQPFFNLRYIGGGASNEDPKDYVENWLQFLCVSLGVTVRAH